MKWASPISAVRGCDALFPNAFGEDLLLSFSATAVIDDFCGWQFGMVVASLVA